MERGRGRFILNYVAWCFVASLTSMTLSLLLLQQSYNTISVSCPSVRFVRQLYLTLEEIRRGERRRTGVLDMLQGSQYLVWYFQVTHTHTHMNTHYVV
jgi:hypothetical protein